MDDITVSETPNENTEPSAKTSPPDARSDSGDKGTTPTGGDNEGPAPVGSGSKEPDAAGKGKESSSPEPSKRSDSADSVGTFRVPRKPMYICLVIWMLSALAGTAARMIPRNSELALEDGTFVTYCQRVRPDLIENGAASYWQLCTASGPLDPNSSPPRREYYGYLFREYDLGDFLLTLLRPELWLTWGVGLMAIIFLIIFAETTGTIRAGLAVSISVVFISLLLFPRDITFNIPEDIQAELLQAWRWVILFYFGSEAAVQAMKILMPGNSEVPGDLNPASSTTGSPTTPDSRQENPVDQNAPGTSEEALSSPDDKGEAEPKTS